MIVHVMAHLEDQIIKQTAARRGVPLPAEAGMKDRMRRVKAVG